MISLSNDARLRGRNRHLSHRCWLSHLAMIAAISLSALCGRPPAAAAASSQPALRQNAEVMVFAEPDEFSTSIETIRDGESLSPLGEMTGPGGLKWFMVKTKSGNVGWIKAGDSSAAKKIDVHFRSLPNEATSIGPGSSPPPSTPRTPARGAIAIPVKINGPKVVVPVTFKNGNSTATGYLAVDTGAAQTMISTRIAREIRLLSIDSQRRFGIGGSVVVNVGLVESVNVGGAEVNGMRVSIHDRVLDLGYEGLLGFDFLGRFQMAVDSKKQVMVLTPLSQ